MRSGSRDLSDVRDDVQGDGAHRFVLAVPADLLALDGHFPTAPVLPAWAQLHAIAGRARRAWPDLGPFRGATSLKFHAIVLPGSELVLDLRRIAGSSRVKVSLSSDDRVLTRGGLVFGEGA